MPRSAPLMIAVLAAPTVAERWDLAVDAPGAATWDLTSLDQQVGGWFADRDPGVGFAADAIMQLTPAVPTASRS